MTVEKPAARKPPGFPGGSAAVPRAERRRGPARDRELEVAVEKLGAELDLLTIESGHPRRIREHGGRILRARRVARGGKPHVFGPDLVDEHATRACSGTRRCDDEGE